MVTRARVGLKREPEFFLKELNETLRADWNAILSQPKDTSLEKTKAKKLQLRYSEEELAEKGPGIHAQSEMEGRSGAAKIKLADGEDIYVGEVQSGNQKSYLFSKLASRAPTCDLCHATHFFFTFDEKGMIVNFFPLQVTKVDNVPWDSKEVEKMRQRLVGRSILQPDGLRPPGGFDLHGYHDRRPRRRQHKQGQGPLRGVEGEGIHKVN